MTKQSIATRIQAAREAHIAATAEALTTQERQPATLKQREELAGMMGLKSAKSPKVNAALEVCYTLHDAAALQASGSGMMLEAALEARKLGLDPDKFASFIKPALKAAGLADKTVRNRLSDLRAILKADKLPAKLPNSVGRLADEVRKAEPKKGPAQPAGAKGAPAPQKPANKGDGGDKAHKGADSPIVPRDDLPALDRALLALGEAQKAEKNAKRRKVIESALKALEQITG